MASDAALLWRTTTVVRHWRNIANNGEVEPDCLQSAHGGFASCSRSFDQHFHFFEPMAHCLARSILSHHLGSISSAFTRTFEANLAGARPSDHVAFQISDRHDRVVERCEHMRNARMNVLASFGFDDLWLVNLIG